MLVRKYDNTDINSMVTIWNEVVENGVAVDDNDEVVGLYILHPNNVGRCGHICNASYAVNSIKMPWSAYR